MTTTSRPAAREEELAPAPTRTAPLVRATGPGFAEIKKHNRNGMRGGLAQLRRRHEPSATRDLPRYLITYLPLDSGGQPTDTGVASQVSAFAVRFDNWRGVPTTPGAIRTWMRLGEIELPPVSARFPSVRDEAGFGREVEKLVRRRFVEKVVAPTRPRGRKGYPYDVVWNELAEFYSELARELGSAAGSFRF